MNLAIVECRECGAAYWVEAWIAEKASGAIDGGPCCFGHPVLDIETYSTERAALKAFPACGAAPAHPCACGICASCTSHREHEGKTEARQAVA